MNCFWIYINNLASSFPADFANARRKNKINLQKSIEYAGACLIHSCPADCADHRRKIDCILQTNNIMLIMKKILK